MVSSMHYNTASYVLLEVLLFVATHPSRLLYCPSKSICW
jgi:hypothetical protein